MVQKVNFNNLTGDTLTVGNTVITGTGVTVGGSELAGGAKVYANASVLPTSGLTAGELAFTGNAMFITTGSGWYRIALVNQDPTITLSESSISLGATGNTVFFTYTTSDPDGTTPTVTLANSGIANTSVANVNLYTANNTVRIDNFSATDWSGTITLTASDGISTAFDSLTVSVAYLSQYWDETALSIGTSSTNGLDNSTFVDRSTNALTVTPSGTPTQTAFHPYLDNWSVFTDGANDTTTDQIHTSDSFINMGTGDFTIELWCQSYVNADRDGLFTFKSSSTAYNFMFRNATTAEVWELYHSIGSAVTVTYANSANPLNEWVHHAFVRSSGTLVWYINGVAKQTIANHAEDFDDVDIVQVGRYSAGRWPGWISNFRVIKGDAIYTSNFTVPTEPLSVTANTILLLNSSYSFKNRGSLTTTIETSGTIGPQISAFNPFDPGSEYALGENKGSVYLNGSNEYVGIPDNDDFELTGDFTIELWMYYISGTATYPSIIGGNGSSSNGWNLYVAATNKIAFWHGSFLISGNNNDFIPNSWNHIALTRSGSDIKLFVNGEQTGTATSSATFNQGTADSGSRIGYDIGANGYIKGYFVDVKIQNGTAAYTSAFTPPTSPLTNSGSDTVLYLPMDNAGIFDKTGNCPIILSGDTATSTTYTKYATTSVFTDTGGMLINNVDSPLSNDFTYEGWLYPTEVPGSGNALISHGWGAYGVFVFYSSNTQYSLYMSSSGSGWDVVSGENINVTPWTGSWKHFAFTRSGNTIRVFLDGTQTYTKTISGSLMSLTAGTNNIVGVGSAIDGTSGVHGAMYIENFQIHKNLAKYTANFTPPTGTQGRAYQATS